jgi:mycothiol synthase
MRPDSCIIRNYRPTDAEEYVRFYSEAESICHSCDSFLLAWLTDKSARPADFCEEDLLLAEREGAIVGACRVVPELTIGRAVLRLFAAPRRSRDVTVKLLRAALERAHALGAARVHADLREDDSASRNLFADLGFTPVRRYTEMTLALGSVSIPEFRPDPLTYRSLQPGEEAEFTRLQNHVFGGSWGFCPNTTPQIVQQLSTPGYHHDGVILACQREKLVGYCWTALPHEPRGTAHRAPTKVCAGIGRIHMMGIAPDLRNQGLGKHVLWAGLRHLASEGVHSVELTVDNENAPASSLYRRTGFEPMMGLVWYEKEISCL